MPYFSFKILSHFTLKIILAFNFKKLLSYEFTQIKGNIDLNQKRKLADDSNHNIG